MKKLLAFALLLSSCGGGSSPHLVPIPPVNLMSANAWEIGPIISGKNYSHGVPLHPTPVADGFAIDLPQQDGVHYVTTYYGSLAGKSFIRMDYRVELAPGAAIHPVTSPAGPSIIALYFQRAGDDWSGTGKYETYRWFAGFVMQTPITAGDHEIVAPLDGNWGAVETSTRSTNLTAFNSALVNADRVGFVLGGGTGLGHGVYATGQVRIVVTDFTVQ